MISRVIEAKPEELRVFLEEAAGVSRYKERRRETENRLADTRENLARITDIRLELGAQLEKLEAQAQVATRYKEYQSDLQLKQHLLWYLRRRANLPEPCHMGAAAAGTAKQRVAATKDKLDAERDALPQAEDSFRAAQDHLNETRSRLMQAQSRLQLEQANLAHLERGARSLEGRRERLAAELSTLTAPDAAAMRALQDKRAALQTDLRTAQTHY